MKFERNASAVSTRRSIASRPSGWDRSRLTERLPRLGCSIMKFTPRAPNGTRPEVISPRCGSPVTGCSILMTSAPQSTSTDPPEGTNIQLATSMTRIPSSGPGMGRSPSVRREADGLGLGEDLQALEAALAADAPLLVAAERGIGAVPDAAVERERAGADAAGHA